MKIQISPSILSADFGKLNEDIKSIEKYADRIHLDVMDGHFVDNLTFGAPVIRCLKTQLFKGCHLMISNPEKGIDNFIQAKVDAISFHIEAVQNPKRLIRKIQKAEIQAGIAIKPKTHLGILKDILPLIDFVLIMTVEPGFGGQKFMMSQVKKIEELRKKYPKLDITVDGGINEKTAKIAIKAGANILVAGSSVFQAKDRGKAIERLKR